MKILYVEDEIAHVELAQRTLEENLQAGFVLLHAESLQDALKIIETESDIDLVLTDLRLPDGSGLDLLKTVQRLPSPPAVVLVTGQGDQEVAVAALKAGAADYLVKQTDYLHRLPVVISNAVAQNRLARQQAELREVQARFRTLVEQIPAAVYTDLADQHNTRDYVSPQIEEISGFTPQEWLKVPDFIKTIVHPEDRSKFIEANESTNQTGEPFNLEYRILRKDGLTRTIHDMATLVRDEKGKPIYWQGILFDITKERESQQAILASEERFRRIFHSTPIATSVVTVEEGRFVDANQAFQNLVGIDLENLIGHTSLDLGFWQNKESRKDLISQLKEHGTIKGREVRYLNVPDGPKDTLGFYELINLGNEACLLAMFHDVTEQKKTQKALQTERDFALQVLNNMGQGLTVIDKDSRFEYVNPAYASMLGYAVEELIGKTPNDVTIASDRALLIEELNRRIKGLASTYESGLIHKDSHEVPVVITGVPRQQNGEINGAIAVVTDLTVQKQTEQALESQVKELTALHAVATAEAESLSEDEVIQNVTAAISQIYSEVCGILLLDATGKILTPHPSYFGADISNWQSGYPITQGITGGSVSTGKIIRTGDVTKEPGYIEIASQVISELCVPIQVQERVIGVINVESKFSDKFTEHDEGFLTTIASGLGTTLEKLRLFNEEQRRANEFTALYATTSQLTTKWDLQSLLEIVLSQAMELLDSTGGGIYLYDTTQNDLFVAVARGVIMKPGTRLQMDEGMAGRVAQSRLPLIVDDYNSWQNRSSQYANSSIRAVIEVPMQYSGELIGVLAVLESDDSQRKFTEADVRLLSLFAAQAASAIKNANLFEAEKQRREDAEKLREVTASLGGSLKLGPLLESILDSAARIIHFDTASIFLDGGHNEMEIVAIRGFQYPEKILGKRFSKDAKWHEAALSGQSLIIPDAQIDLRFEKWENSNHIHGWMGVPMIAHDSTIGFINFDSQSVNAFAEKDATLAQTFANSAAIAIENARLFEEEIRRTRIIETLADIANEIATTREVLPILNKITLRTLELLHANNVALYLLNDDNSTIKVISAQGIHRQELLSHSLKIGEGITGKVVATGKSEIVYDFLNDPRRKLVPGTPENDVEKDTLMSAPLILRGKSIGAINAWRLRANGLFNESELNFLISIAHQVSITIESANLFQESVRRAQEASAIAEVGREISATLQISLVLERIATYAKELLNAESSAVYLPEPATTRLKAIAAIGIDVEEIKNDSLQLGIGILGNIAVQKMGEIVNDTINDPRTIAIKGTELNPLEHIMGVPVLSKDRLTGLVAVWRSGRDNEFKLFELDFLSALAQQAAVAIENARLYDETQRRLSELEAINRVSTSLRQAQSIDEMLPILLNEALLLVRTVNGSIWLYDSSSNALIQRIASGTDMNISHKALKAGDGIVGYVFTTSEKYISPELKSDPLLSAENRESMAAGLSGICIPIQSTAGPVGVLIAELEMDRKIAEEINLLTILAELTGNAIHRAELFSQSQEQIHRLTTLRDIDAAIASSTDLRVTLNILMDHTLKHLKTDAVDIMLYHPELQSLTYLASAGFINPSPSRPLMRLGEGLAGQVVMKGSIEQVSDLRISTEVKRDPMLIREGFITYFGIPLIVKGQVKGVFEIFHRSTFTPTSEWMQFLQTLAGQAAIAIDNAQLFDHLQRSNQEVTQAYDTTLEGWARALELRDRETEGHTRRVTELTMQLARYMGVQDDELINIYRGVLLHDIGKMGVPDQILRKTGPLIESEWVEMRKHPEYAFNLLAPIPYLRPALDIPYCHHEHWDGSGYPRGLKGEQIPLSARMFSIVDIWDALLSDRSYRKAWPETKVIDYIKEISGNILDPKVVSVFFKMLGIQE